MPENFLNSSDCHLLTLAEIETAADVISQAFMDDPLCRFMLPAENSRFRSLHKFFKLYSEINIANQRGYGSGELLVGVAFWKFPDQGELSISVRSLGKILPLLFSSYPLGYLRARRILRQIDAMHEKYASGRHYYLDNLGVLPSSQGQGIASKLLRPVLEMADAQNMPAYTDTVTSANVPIYEHFGFESVEESAIPGTGITAWALLRPARSY